jgi:hypothetical protein
MKKIKSLKYQSPPLTLEQTFPDTHTHTHTHTRTRTHTHTHTHTCTHRDLYLSDFSAAQLNIVSAQLKLIRSTKLPFSLHSCWLCLNLYRLSSLTQSHFLLPATTCPYNEAKKTRKSPVSKTITSLKNKQEGNGMEKQRILSFF